MTPSSDPGWFAEMPVRGRLLLAVVGLLLLAAPTLLGGYALSMLILCLFFAYLGLAWNVMMGFAGQLSLGHAIYLGLGAYASAGLYSHYGLSPWLGALVAMALAGAVGGLIGWMGFRFGVRGVYFALLTIAFAEFTRILFDHIGWIGGSGGLFLPVISNAAGWRAWVNLRGGPVLFYYVILALTVGALALSHALLRSRLGYYWRAIRDNQEAAEAVGINLFRYKMIATLLSAMMTALGGVFFAFYYNGLVPEQIFAKSRSIELVLAPIIGGLGTLFGPVLGAFLLTPLGEITTELLERSGHGVPGLKQVLFGVMLAVILLLQPQGIWPALARRLGLDRKRRS